MSPWEYKKASTDGGLQRYTDLYNNLLKFFYRATMNILAQAYKKTYVEV